MALLLVALALAGSGCGGDNPDAEVEPTEAPVPRLQVAYDNCAAVEPKLMAKVVDVQDEGEAVAISTRLILNGMDALDCMLSQLQTPESIETRMGQTTAMMGELSDSHDGLEYRWTYHPDNGMNLLVREGD